MGNSYEEHIREREQQVYASTRNWGNQHRQRKGVAGEIALAEYFGYEASKKNKPFGDSGIDRWIEFEIDGVAKLYSVDVKTSQYGDWLRVPVGEVVAQIYVLAHSTPDGSQARLVGWAWREELLAAPSKPWPGGDTISYYIPAWARPDGKGKLHAMVELADRYTGTNHDPEMIEILASVEGPDFFAGIVLQEGRVVEAAPRVRRELKGKTRDQVRDICREKGWLVRVVDLRRR